MAPIALSQLPDRIAPAPRSRIENDRQARSFIGTPRASVSNGGLRPRRKGCESPLPSRHPSVDRRLVMSSPVKDDADKQLIRALPWVSDPQRQDEARRLEEDVLAAAQRLKRDSGGLSSQARVQLSQGLRLSESRSSEEKRKLEEVTARVLAALKPELMPSSLRAEMRRPGLGLVTGLVGAIGVAAAVALVVASVVRIPINAAVSSEEDAGRNGSVSTAVL